MTTTTMDALPFTGDVDADRLLASDPIALLIGFVLDQQVPLEKAFIGPLELRRRVGTVDPARIAGIDPAQLDAVFRERPALHRFPGSMARRVHELCAAISSEYGGDASRIWSEARDGADLERRLRSLPGIGEMKAKTLLAILFRRYGVRLEGLEERLPTYPTLGDVDSDEARERYREGKRARRARERAAAGG
jgi:uncharacterized HhH-GPD family protein